MRVEKVGHCTLYLADCMDVLPTLDSVDAVVTDPPYGIKQDKGFGGFGGFGKPIKRNVYAGTWDQQRPSQEIFNQILLSAKNCVIFGGNYFTDLLPVGRHWFVWDKRNTMPSFSDCELAWSNIDKKSVKLLTYEYNGLLGRREERVHPTQKPYEVMRWCIEKLPKPSDVILDPFMGSGSTGIAAKDEGFEFIGIEREKEYFEIAEQRVSVASPLEEFMK